MTQGMRRAFLINRLLDEQPRYRELQIPQDAEEQKRLLRSLLNVRMPGNISDDFLAVQDEYLREETAAKGITDIADLLPVSEGIYLWQGDITTLRCDAIVNAANSGMTGCYAPCHGCIDNCIHTYAGIQLRLACAEIMEKQGHEEETGKAKITPAYNLPCKYVIHTVGPIISGRLTDMRIPSELLPVCPHCGKPLTMNLRSDNRFVEDEGWHRAAGRYEDFLRAGKGRQLLLLELGVGYNTPGIIKYPFWQMAAANSKAVYACVNYGDAACPDEIMEQSVCINEDIGKVLGDLGGCYA